MYIILLHINGHYDTFEVLSQVSKQYTLLEFEKTDRKMSKAGSIFLTSHIILSKVIKQISE